VNIFAEVEFIMSVSSNKKFVPVKVNLASDFKVLLFEMDEN